MRDSQSNAGGTGVCTLMDWRLVKFVGPYVRSLKGSSGGRLPERRRSLRVEPLEERTLMDASGLNWFAVVAPENDVAHAGTAAWTAENTVISSTQVATDESSSNVYDWIVQFSTDSLTNVSTVSDTVGLLVGGNGIEFEILQGLGLVGMVLVRSNGASVSSVEQYFSQLTCVSSFEQDAYHQSDTATNSSATSSAAALSSISTSSAWTLTPGSSSVVVAVIDTGVDYTHKALSSSVWVNPGEIAGNGRDDDGNGFVDDIYGYDFANDDANPMDDNGHGTHVTGIITSVADCSIMCLKFMGSDGSGYLSDAIAAINYATMMRTKYGVNVRVDNNSWGGGTFSSALQSAIQASNSAGILFVVAAGNDGTNNDSTAQYPGNYNSANIIVVAASTTSGALASFSNYGPATVDIAAPGVTIYSTLPKNRYGCYSGTSMAAPYVSAVAALAWSLDPNASVAEVRNAIIKGANSVSSMSGKLVAGGTLNAYSTLILLGASEPVADDSNDDDDVSDNTLTPDSSDSVGLYSSSTNVFYLDDDNDSTTDAVYCYDGAGGNWTVITGDWDGDGTDTAGFYNSVTSKFYLLDSNESDAAVTVVAFGAAGCGWKPIAGDWNGDGRDTVALYDRKTSKFYLRNTNDATSTFTVFKYGVANSSWLAIAGDWNGDGIDTVGVYNPTASRFALRSTNATSSSSACFVFGSAKGGCTPVAGDWNGDGRDTIGLYKSTTSTFYLRNSNTAGSANVTLAYGSANGGLTPIAGNWAGLTTNSKTTKSSVSPFDESPSYESAFRKAAWLDFAVNGLLNSRSDSFEDDKFVLESAKTDLGASLGEGVLGGSALGAGSSSSRVESSSPSAGRLSLAASTAIWGGSTLSYRSIHTTDCLLEASAVDFHAIDEVFDLLGELLDQTG